MHFKVVKKSSIPHLCWSTWTTLVCTEVIMRYGMAYFQPCGFIMLCISNQILTTTIIKWSTVFCIVFTFRLANRGLLHTSCTWAGQSIRDPQTMGLISSISLELSKRRKRVLLMLVQRWCIVGEYPLMISRRFVVSESFFKTKYNTVSISIAYEEHSQGWIDESN